MHYTNWRIDIDIDIDTESVRLLIIDVFSWTHSATLLWETAWRSGGVPRRTTQHRALNRTRATWQTDEPSLRQPLPFQYATAPPLSTTISSRHPVYFLYLIWNSYTYGFLILYYLELIYNQCPYSHVCIHVSLLCVLNKDQSIIRKLKLKLQMVTNTNSSQHAINLSVRIQE